MLVKSNCYILLRPDLGYCSQPHGCGTIWLLAATRLILCSREKRSKIKSTLPNHITHVLTRTKFDGNWIAGHNEP